MKRFTETTKWQDSWYRKLSPKLKCLWQYLVDHCDPCGVIEPDWELASFQIGEQVSLDDLADFGERLGTTKAGKLWIIKFVEFQYGQLSEACPAHKPVFRALQTNGIKYPFNRVSNTLQDKRGEDKNNKRIGEPENSDFSIFWDAYPKKVGKKAALRAWKANSPDLSKCLAAIDRQKTTEQWRKDGGQFIPHPATWLHQGRWDDAPKIELGRKPSRTPKPIEPDPEGWTEWLAEEYPKAVGNKWADTPQDIRDQFNRRAA